MFTYRHDAHRGSRVTAALISATCAAVLLPALGFLLLAASPVRAQALDSALSYFPLAVGNRWQYHYTWSGVGVNQKGEVLVQVTDTTTGPDGERYFVVTSGRWPPYDVPWHSLQYLRIDSASGVVYMIVPPDTTVTVRQRLRCLGPADSVLPWEWTIGCAITEIDTLFGMPAACRPLRFSRMRYAYGIGVIQYYRPDHHYDPEQSTTHADIIYARIDGHEYGRMQGVNDRALRAGTTVELSPNPASGAARLHLAVEQPCTLTILLTDMLGSAVAAPQTVRVEAGPCTLPLDVAALPCGAYYCTVSIDGQQWHRPLIVVR